MISIKAININVCLSSEDPSLYHENYVISKNYVISRAVQEDFGLDDLVFRLINFSQTTTRGT